jgi:hypothetical protein
MTLQPVQGDRDRSFRESGGTLEGRPGALAPHRSFAGDRRGHTYRAEVVVLKAVGTSMRRRADGTGAYVIHDDVSAFLKSSGSDQTEGNGDQLRKGFRICRSL